MRLTSVRIAESPRQPKWMRLSGEVVYDGGSPREETVWFEVPAADAEAFSTAGDAWMASLAPVAAKLHEPLSIGVPADPVLRDNMREVTRVWRSWYPELREVPIDTLPPISGSTSGSRTAAFFTGGVDSFFTALRHDAGEGTPRSIEIDDLIFVHGFDIPLGNERGFANVRSSLERAADGLHKRFVVVATNLRETRFAEASWSRVAHGAGLAGVAHALGSAYGTVIIASSAGYRDLRFWGSHPLTDPMFTSSRTTVVHDGAAFMRVEKTEYVARSPLAMRHLRVCYLAEDGGNCGRCINCYRTMLALESLGALEGCATFDRSSLDLDRAGRIFCRQDFDVRQFGYVLELAHRMGRPDVERAVNRSLRDSARLTRRISRLRALGDLPLLWRWAPQWERQLVRGWIV
ncbi:MAG TPA: hypothetical protein VMM77_07860 [Gemmatimonadaceae bacterium]|nr:hypothetical protein [Gemmatimonadaceae bacterium]